MRAPSRASTTLRSAACDARLADRIADRLRAGRARPRPRAAAPTTAVAWTAAAVRARSASAYCRTPRRERLLAVRRAARGAPERRCGRRDGERIDGGELARHLRRRRRRARSPRARPTSSSAAIRARSSSSRSRSLLGGQRRRGAAPAGARRPSRSRPPRAAPPRAAASSAACSAARSASALAAAASRSRAARARAPAGSPRAAARCRPSPHPADRWPHPPGVTTVTGCGASRHMRERLVEIVRQEHVAEHGLGQRPVTRDRPRSASTSRRPAGTITVARRSGSFGITVALPAAFRLAASGSPRPRRVVSGSTI